MNGNYFFGDKAVNCGNPWHGVIRTAGGVNTLTMPNDDTKQVYGTFGGEVWYFKHPDAVAADTPAELETLGGKWYEDAVFSGDNKIYAPSLDSEIDPVQIANTDVWLRVADDGKVYPFMLLIDQVAIDGNEVSCRVRIYYSPTQWNPIAPTEFGTFSLVFTETLTAYSPSSVNNTSEFAKVGDVRRDGKKVLVVNGCYVGGSGNYNLGYPSISLGCWEITLGDSVVSAESVWQWAPPGEQEVQTEPQSYEYISNRQETSGGNVDLYETWYVTSQHLMLRNFAFWLFLACYDASGNISLIGIGYDYYDTLLVRQVTEWERLAWSGQVPPETVPSSPVEDPPSTLGNYVGLIEELPEESTGYRLSVVENGVVVIARDDENKWLGEFDHQVLTRHVLMIVRGGEEHEQDDFRTLVGPGVIKDISLPPDGYETLATYDHREQVIHDTNSFDHSSIAVI